MLRGLPRRSEGYAGDQWGCWGYIGIDSETLEFNIIGGMSSGAALQNASTAIEINDKIWVGTYNGDRVGYFSRN